MKLFDRQFEIGNETKDVTYEKAHQFAKDISEKKNTLCYGDIFKLSIEDYLKLDPILQKKFILHRQFHSPSKQEVVVPPYMLGRLTQSRASEEYIDSFLKNSNLDDTMIDVTKAYLREHNLYKYENIPDEYINNDRSCRRKLLAGLLENNLEVNIENNKRYYKTRCHIMAVKVKQLLESLGGVITCWEKTSKVSSLTSFFGFTRSKTKTTYYIQIDNTNFNELLINDSSKDMVVSEGNSRHNFSVTKSSSTNLYITLETSDDDSLTLEHYYIVS